jgi:plasmid stabilization system protein ParE
MPHIRTDKQPVTQITVIEPEYLYRVFYRIDGKLVTVIRILHGAQY